MPKKLKILHILPALSCGGAERVCVDILKNLNQDVFSPSLLLFKANNEGQEMQTELEGVNIPTIKIKKRFVFDPINFLRIFLEIKKIQPNIVHTHLGGDIYGRLAAKLLNIPVIVSTEHNLNKSEKSCATFLKKITARWATKIFAVSEAVKQDAIKRYSLKAEMIEVIYNGIDINSFSQVLYNHEQELLKDKSRILVGAMGRLTQQKGFMTLIEATAKSKNKNYFVEIAGVGELESVLKKRINDLELVSRIKLIGNTDNKKFFKKIDIFVCPSYWEGLGLTVLEAAVMRKPIIASQIDGINEILDKESAYFFPAGDDDALAQKIDYLLNNLSSDEVGNKTERAYKIIHEKFSSQSMVNFYSDWYMNLTNI